MNKSIYSLVLSDEVIDAIDAMAYSMNTSRSNLINQILAEAVSYVTPEKRMKDIFSRMEEIFSGSNSFQPIFQPSESMFSIKSALSYKYNPTVKYSLELNRSIENYIGKLKINLRTQNQALIVYMVSFFKLWAELEKKYLNTSEITISGGRFSKNLICRSKSRLTEERLAKEISDYINLLDRSLKLYFSNLEYESEVAKKIEKDYTQYLATHEIVA